MHHIVSLLTGLLMGLGLIVSGMTDPSKVQGFLDLGGAWDPSLALTMGGAIAMAAPAFAWARSKPRSMLGAAMRLPSHQDIDKPLVFGSLAFGAGWGLAGFCPGPALVSAAAGHSTAWIFVASMVAGMMVSPSLGTTGTARR